jgi:hypothetical protein
MLIFKVESDMLEQAATINVDEMDDSFTESNQVALPIPIFSSRLQPVGYKIMKI